MTRGLLAAGVGLACMGGLTVTPAAEQTFRSGVYAVAVDVLVTRDGRPVIDLTADDFTVLDNDVPQQIDSVLLEEVPITLLMVLDTSASVRGAPLVQLRAAAEAAAEVLRPDDRVGMVTFSHNVRMVVEPPSRPASVPDALGRVRAGGATALYDATFAAFALREQTVGRTLMLVFSDGDDTASWLDPREVLDTRNVATWSSTASASTVLRETTGWPGWPGRAEYRRAAGFRPSPICLAASIWGYWSRTPRRGVRRRGHRTVRAAFSRVVSEFRSRYLVTYSPTGVESAGWHALEVRVEGREREVQARRGYLR